jgi:hypothetical protein
LSGWIDLTPLQIPRPPHNKSAFLVGGIAGRLGGTEAGLTAGVVVLFLSEVLVQWIERRGLK